MSRIVHIGRAALSRISLISLLILCLSACGGGGASTSGSGGSTGTGSGGSTGTGTGGPAPVEPPVPQPIYTGANTQAVVSFASAGDLSQEALSALQFLTSNRSDRVPGLSPAKYDGTAAGDIKGSVKITGTIGTNDSGWVEQTFSDYESSSSPGVVLNGTFTFYQTAILGGVGFIGTMGFSHYTETVNGLTYEFNGTIDDRTGNVGNLSISIGSSQIFLSNLAIEIASNGFSSVTGRIYDSLAGYMDLSTPAPVEIFPAEFWATDIYPGSNTGELMLTGQHHASVHVEPLNDYFAYVGLDLDGDGKIDYGTRIDRTTDEPDAVQPTNTSVAALGQQSSVPTTGGSITIDGRFSYGTDNFVSYSWKLLAAPLGSAAQVMGTEPTLQFKPDVLGEYLIQLTVTSNGKSATDVVVADSDPRAFQESTATPYKALSYVYAHVGEKVSLDARASMRLSAITFSGTIWSLHAPAGSHASIADPTALVASFTPDVPGIYYSIVGPDQSFGGTSQPAAFTVISVDQPVRFAPPVAIAGGINTDFDGFATGQFGGTGAGLALMYTNSFLSTADIQWWGAMSNGLFGAGGSTSATTSDHGDLLVTDLNGDNISDLVTSSSSGTNCPMNFRESGLSGSALTYTLSSVGLDPDCSLHSSNISMIRSTTIDGRYPAVVVLDPSYGSGNGSSIAAFIADSSGNMQAPVITPINDANLYTDNGVVHDFELQDVTGDGEPDLIVSVTYLLSGATYNVVQVYQGVGDGNFTYLASYTPSGNSNSWQKILIADLNGDGKPDIAVTYADTLDIFYNDSLGHGNFSTTPDTRSLDCAPRYMTAMDINGDGHPDLVMAPGGCDTGDITFLRYYLSTVSGSTTSLGQEQLYPIITDKTSVFPEASNAASADFDGDGLQDLMLNFGYLLYMPQLPAATSATISLARRTLAEEVTSQPKPAVSHDWLKAAAKVRVPRPPLQ